MSINTKPDTTVTFKVESMRTFPIPKELLGERHEKQYRALVNFEALPKNISTEVNPRDQKMTTKVGRSLIAGVTNTETDFYLNNRGILISAKSVKYNPNSSEITIDLGSPDNDASPQYGIIDGGHTYRAIIDNLKRVINPEKKFVQLEIITNIDNLVALNSARNSSVSVSEPALANLAGKLDFIKQYLEGSPLENLVAYRDNEDKPIDVVELVRLMLALNPQEFGENDAPTVVYNGASNAFKRFEKAYD